MEGTLERDPRAEKPNRNWEGKQEIKKQENHPQMGGSEGRQVFSLHEPRG